MKDVLVGFEWTVAPKYEWRNWLDTAGNPVALPRLTSATGVESLWNRSQERKQEYGPVLHTVLDGEPRRYQPMKPPHAGLFQEFAKLDYTNPSAVLAFAARYGELGVEQQVQLVRCRGGDGELVDHHASGEPFLRWALEICLLREGLRLASGRQSSADQKRLRWLADRNLQHVRAGLGFTSTGDLELELGPVTLIAALWLQFGLALKGDKHFVGCKFCGRMFEISTEDSGYRRHRQFCTDSCKTNDYRRRKRTALRLAASGEDLQAIAINTGTAAKTVRAWLGPEARKRQSNSGER